MMNADIYLVIRLSDGRVVNATVGCPAEADGYECVPREGAAADAWIGWTRDGEGSFTDTSADYDPEA